MNIHDTHLKMATYYVVPLRGDGDHRAQPCRYHAPDGTPVPAEHLHSRAQGFRTDFVCLAQASEAQQDDWGVPRDQRDVHARLFAAVAKTLQQSAQMPNLLPAQDLRVVVPVAGHSQRGLLLIFTHDHDGSPQFLTASLDPIIKNTGD